MSAQIGKRVFWNQNSCATCKRPCSNNDIYMRELSHIEPPRVGPSSSETAHDINRSMILELIRQNGSISRADLARITGLQKSTVSTIADGLLDAGWVREYSARAATGKRLHTTGRRPNQLTIDESLAVLAVDLRPELTSLAAVDLQGRMLSQHSIQLSRDLVHAERQLSSLAKKVVTEHRDLSFQGLGVSLPGRVNSDTGILEFAPNLPWKGWDIGAYLSAETGLPVEMQNAADAIVLFERWSDSFRDVHDALVITISEGIGVGILSGGRQLHGSHGIAGEFGHVVLDPNGFACGCGKKGCWEMLASNRAIEIYASSLKRKSSSSKKTYAEILQAAENSEPEALSLIEKQYQEVGTGLKLVLPFAPEIILFAGDFVSLWERFKPVIESSIKDNAISGHIPKLMTAGYGSATRLQGAVALILQRIYRSGVRASARSVPIR